MLKNRSVVTINEPEFINLEPYNPLISQCEIKVFYLGKNRNGSYITKDVAIQMANSLPGTPIVAAYREDIEDFGDHGHVMHIEDGEIKFSVKTRPYGFVAPDAEVWFQKFLDTDEFGNEVEREYLMTTGYLWTGQYEEAKKALEQGQPQSMELDESTMDGRWATDSNSGLEFFIINDALFSKLCILGDDVEPCFEGAAVTAPEVSKNFSKDEEFARTLFTMMNQLKDALSNNEGGLNMPNEETLFEENVEEVVEEAIEEPAAEEVVEEAPAVEEEFAKKDEEDPEDEPEEEPAEEEEDDEEPAEDDKKKKYSVEDYDALLEQVEALQSELDELRAFKLQSVNKQKDELIARYFMLSDEDKAEIVAHKEEYSLEEIEAKLAVLYVEKNVNFDSIDGTFEEKAETADSEEPIVTFSLESETTGAVPAFVEALRQNRR